MHSASFAFSTSFFSPNVVDDLLDMRFDQPYNGTPLCLLRSTDLDLRIELGIKSIVVIIIITSRLTRLRASQGFFFLSLAACFPHCKAPLPVNISRSEALTINA